MGQISSKFLVHDPASFATPYTPSPSNVVSEEEKANWRSYDYVIVGGGSAGCVLASRLSEDTNATVLLIEAGQSHEQSLYTRIPLAFNKLFKTAFDWNYETIPQKAFGGRTVYWPRGRMLGGTSSMNAMIYHRGDPADFDAWERQGAKGWGYESLKKYFIKSQRYIPQASHTVDESIQGSNGPWVHTHVPTAPICSKILEAAEKVGVPLRDNFNTNDNTIGAGPFLAAVDDKHERSSSATAYLTPDVLQRPNLTVAVTITTERILFTKKEDGTPKAVGVQISSKRDGPRFAVGANREVIVCAGVIGSPQVLQLSGIGPSVHLTGLGIPVIHDLPAVGANLKDHLSAGAVNFRARPDSGTWDHLAQNPLYAAAALIRWLTFGTGPMSSLSFQLGMFIRSDDERLPLGPPLPTKDMSSGPRAPDIEYMWVPLTVINHGLGYPPAGTYGISVGSLLLKPASSGTVRLRSMDPYDHPLIDGNYLSDESDVNVLIKSVRFLLHLAHTPPLSDVLDLRTSTTGSKDDIFWPGDADPDKITDEQIKEFIKNAGQSALHPTSSVRMGDDPTTSAVDAELRVHGVDGLRVVDASVFPDQVSGHPWAVVVAIAERAADLIKSAHASA